MPSGESASLSRAVSRNSGASLNILAFKQMENYLAVLKWLKTDRFTQIASGFTRINARGYMQIVNEAEGTVLLCCFSLILPPRPKLSLGTLLPGQTNHHAITLETSMSKHEWDWIRAPLCVFTVTSSRLLHLGTFISQRANISHGAPLVWLRNPQDLQRASGVLRGLMMD